MSLDEAQAIFSQPETIAGYTVKPWTLRRFNLVYPITKAIIDRLRSAGLTLDNAETFLADKALDLLPELLPFLADLLAASLDIPKTKVEELDVTMAAALTITIFRQNLVPLKNCLAPAKQTGASIPSPSPA